MQYRLTLFLIIYAIHGPVYSSYGNSTSAYVDEYFKVKGIDYILHILTLNMLLLSHCESVVVKIHVYIR